MLKNLKNTSLYIIGLMNLRIDIHIAPFPKQKEGFNSAYMNQFLLVISRTCEKGNREGNELPHVQ